jgi:MGT family glycosyltransferase
MAIEDRLGDYFDLWFGPATVQDVVAEVDGADVDVLVVDCMFANVPALAEARGMRAAVLVHLPYQPAIDGRWLDGWTWAVDTVNRFRAGLGLDRFEPATSLWAQVWGRADRVLVTTLEAFDFPADDRAANVRYVGPLREPPGGHAGDDVLDLLDGRPLVLVSLSSSYQHQEATLDRITEALAEVDAQVLVTVGPHVDAARVRAGANTIVRPWVPHEAVLPVASLVVGHGGHGTTIAALAAGVPLVCLPMGRDQHLVAERVEALGAGRVVPADAPVTTLRGAAVDVLERSTYREAAGEIAAQLASLGGAALAADELEGIVE